MIYLEQNAEYFNNDIRAMLQAFFDNEKVVTKQEGTRLSLEVVYTQDVDVETEVAKGGYVTYTLSDEDGYHASKMVVVDYLNKMIYAFIGFEIRLQAKNDIRDKKFGDT